MGLNKLVMGLLVFSTIIFGGLFLIGDINNQYDDVNINTDKFIGTNESDNSLYNLSQSMKDDLYGDELDDENTENSMFKGAYKALKLVRETFSVMGNIIKTISKELGIPSFFITMALTALAIFVVFGLVFLIFRLKT